MWLQSIATRRDLIARDEREIEELLRVYERRKANRTLPEFSFLPAPRYPGAEIELHRAAVYHLRIEIEDLERKITLHFGQESTHEY